MLTIRPLTPSHWKDLAALFGEPGASGGCWCMFWRLPRAVFVRQKGSANRQALRKLVQKGDPPGLMAYDGPAPVGWCAIAPRGNYPALARSRIVEGYPVETKEKAPDVFVWNGLASAFRQAGFHEVARRSKTRPIMRRNLR